MLSKYSSRGELHTGSQDSSGSGDSSVDSPVGYVDSSDDSPVGFGNSSTHTAAGNSPCWSSFFDLRISITSS
ncbi:hypothetical protein TNCT_48971 [Trichonephila clavata]|uniref:Uncharacterized protein n=1 Tax=Trichonephila clavata TaxID=2740835 RepID=A0A8X6KMY2_TRICU|nr:hypothetical protein TNCT_48971 [Trichonephila clavata]